MYTSEATMPIPVTFESGDAKHPTPTLSKRLAPVIAAAQPPGSLTLLVGERGNGRLFLATAAAHQISAHVQTPAPGSSKDTPARPNTVTVLPSPTADSTGAASVFGVEGLTSASAQERADLVLARLSDADTRHEHTLVAHNIDRYSPDDLILLKHILHSPRVPRVIATTSGATPSVESAIHGLKHAKIAVGSLDFTDADRYLSRLLGVQRIDPDTLRRWHKRAEGTGYGLAALALGSSTAGSLHRTNGIAWVARVDDTVLSDFAQLHTSSCSPAERQMLELIALAQPISETTLLRSLDALVLSRLFDLGFVSWRQANGKSALVITQSLLAESLCAAVPPHRRLDVYDTVYALLDADRDGQSPVRLPELLLRLVSFGVLCNHPMPAEWLWTAFELTPPDNDPRLALQLSLRVASHPDLLPQNRGQALVKAAYLAKLLGDHASSQTVANAATALLNDPDQARSLTPTTYALLRVDVLYQEALRHHDADTTNTALNLLERRFSPVDERAFEVARTARAYALGSVGRLQECFDLVNDSAFSSDLSLEWIRSRGRGAMALILSQRGLTEQAANLAKRMHALSQLGTSASRHVLDLQAFAWVVSLCLGGRTEAASDTWNALALNRETFDSEESHLAGLLAAAQVILTIQEGRWTDADQQSEQLLAQLQHYDSAGLAPLIAAARSYALAVLGRREEALKYLHLADVRKCGVSEMLGGLVRLHQLRARQWLRENDVGAAADELTSWARQHELPLIELMAIHTACYERGGLPAEQLAHARTVAQTLESDRSSVIMEHIEQICVAPIQDAPQVRMLSKIGLWIPLPPSPGLSPREREVAMFAALGYSSKFIASRLGISTRTVDTHITNVFTKLDVQNREELAVWFERHSNASATQRKTRAISTPRAPR